MTVKCKPFILSHVTLVIEDGYIQANCSPKVETMM